MIDEDADRWQKTTPVGNECRDGGIVSKPGEQHPPQCSRSNVVATDVAGQRDNAEAGGRACFRAVMSSLKSRGVRGMTTIGSGCRWHYVSMETTNADVDRLKHWSGHK